VSTKGAPLTKGELVTALKEKPYDAVLSLLTDSIDKDAFDAASSAKIFANLAVGVNNVDLKEAKARGVIVSSTPGVLTNTVAEHTFALLISLACRIVEGDRFLRAGKYIGWDPLLFLGTDLQGKTLGILGAGRIGESVASKAAFGFGMKIIYYDVRQNETMEKKLGATFKATAEEVLKDADFISIHVPLLPSTHHLMNADRLRMMKKTAYLINTSRGPVIDEAALVDALKNNVIAGAAIDVFENEPNLAPGLAELENVIITPHIASATVKTRDKMAELAAANIIEVLEGRKAPNAVKEN
jgi:glyoxylate reductase